MYNDNNNNGPHGILNNNYYDNVIVNSEHFVDHKILRGNFCFSCLKRFHRITTS